MEHQFPRSVPFGDLKRHHEPLQEAIVTTLRQVVQGGWYILGREVQAFEEAFAAYCGTAYAVGVANGTDALNLALAALAVGPGDEVITVANAGTYQALAIVQQGATPVFADITPETHTLDPTALTSLINSRTRAIIPVHLYGHMADMVAIDAIATRSGIPVIEDAAQAHGAWMITPAGTPRKAGAWGLMGCFSFYPTKNLGGMGDGGAIVTNDASLANTLRALRHYGWRERKYVMTERHGRNSRLDELQAAILRLKLSYLDSWNAARQERANWYHEWLKTTPLDLPPRSPGHVYHLYVVGTDQRDALRQYCTEHGIGTDIHYPLPTHMQPAFTGLVRPEGPGTLPHTERASRRVLSLPLYPELHRDEVAWVAQVVREGLANMDNLW